MIAGGRGVVGNGRHGAVLSIRERSRPAGIRPGNQSQHVGRRGVDRGDGQTIPGGRSRPWRCWIGANGTVHFNSDDLETDDPTGHFQLSCSEAAEWCPLTRWGSPSPMCLFSGGDVNWFAGRWKLHRGQGLLLLFPHPVARASVVAAIRLPDELHPDTATVCIAHGGV